MKKTRPMHELPVDQQVLLVRGAFRHTFELLLDKKCPNDTALAGALAFALSARLRLGSDELKARTAQELRDAIATFEKEVESARQSH